MPAARLLLILVFPGCALAAPALRPVVPVVVSATQPSAVQVAAGDLVRSLSRLHGDVSFSLVRQPPESGRCIWIGSVAHEGRLGALVRDRLEGPESYAVLTTRDGPRELGIVAGADARGAAYGVYALLKKLGCGFYVSGDTWPADRLGAFSFAAWDFADRPLARERLIFNWHNFLSSCSTWNLPDWNRWTDQAQKMGYNAIMVHAYGNNPMASFAFNGATKPVGYLSTTIKGRDWATEHVRDVRRLWGGGVFDGQAFGSDAGLAPDSDRVAAVQQLMQAVFAHAAMRSMDVYFACDVDTVSANPQELIATLPAGARFGIDAGGDLPSRSNDGKFWLADPDTPEGYRYYQAQAKSLLAAYPQISCVTAWFRAGGSPWTDMKLSEMPLAWQEDYAAEIARTPEAAKYHKSHNLFALAKIVRAFERALAEMGRTDVRLAVGSWFFDFMDAGDRFLPPEVKFIPLDYGVKNGESQLRDPGARAVVRRVAGKRMVIPVVWAHHDDRHYVGSPYTPFPAFQSRLDDALAGGFGIIHWTTRPLDVYFTSLGEQVWRNSKDKPLRATCDDMAERWFGPSARATMGEYLYRWNTEGARFGRETGPNFLPDRDLTPKPGNLDDPVRVAAASRNRLKLFARVDRTALSAEQRNRLDYFKGLDNFVTETHLTQARFQRATKLFDDGNPAGARDALTGCRPEEVIAHFASVSSLGGISRGEQGLVVSMNTRWLAPIVRLRQALGLEPVRYNFGPTSHDPLAQNPGMNTYYFDQLRQLWQTLGVEETGASGAHRSPIPSSALDEIACEWIESDRLIRLSLGPIATPYTNGGRAKDSLPLPAGDYRVTLLFADPLSTAEGQRVFDVEVQGGPDGTLQQSRVDVFQLAGQRGKIVERTFDVAIDRAGQAIIVLHPVNGKALISGVVLERRAGNR